VTRRRLVLGLALALVVVLALNVVGLLRYPGGPLKQPLDGSVLWLDLPVGHHPGSRVSAGTGAGITVNDTIYIGTALTNDWPLAVDVESVHLVDATPGLGLADYWIARPGTEGGLPGLTINDPGVDLQADFQALPAELAAGNRPGEGRAVLALSASAGGEYSYSGLAVEYRVGPFSFSTIYDPAITVCVSPLPQGATCSLDEAP
jgi:hypothetical protein